VQLLFDYSGAAFKAAIDLKPDYDFGNNNLGVYYARRGGPEDAKRAEDYFRAAVRINPRYADAFNNLAIVLRWQGKLDEAIATHKAGLELRSDRASDHNNLCRVYIEKYDLDKKNGDLKKAKDDLASALLETDIALKRCDPNFLGAWMSRMEICIKQENLDEAGRCVQRMSFIEPNSPETLHAAIQLGAKYLELNRPDDAIHCFNQILENNKSAPDAYAARGRAYFLKGDLTRAKADFEQVLRIRPDFPGVREALKAIQEQLAKPKK
jgi:tetratricopeptide (TPR) repeat protein